VTGSRAVDRKGASRRGLHALLTARATRIVGLIAFLLAL
jgi:hypothetical protein